MADDDEQEVKTLRVMQPTHKKVMQLPGGTQDEKVSNLLDDIHALQNGGTTPVEHEQASEDDVDESEKATAFGSDDVEARTRTVEISNDVSSETEVTLAENAPIDGVISEVAIAFPPGAQGLVDVAVKHEGDRLLPVEGFIALDDTTPVFRFNEPVQARDELTVLIRNRDSGNSHKITVLVNITQDPQMAKTGTMAMG